MQIELTLGAFRRGLAAVLTAACKDVERPTVAQVQIWHKDDKLCMAATQGLWCAIWQYVDGCLGDVPRFAISRADALFVATVAGAEMLAGEVTLSLQSPFGVECSTAYDSWTITRRHADEIGPDVEALITGTERGAVDTIGLSPLLLAEIRKAFKIARDPEAEGEMIELSFGPSTLAPVLITSPEAPDLAVVLMPMSLGKPVQCEERIGEDGVKRTVRTDTGEVIDEEEVARQTRIPGTEDDPAVAAVKKFQGIAEKLDCAVSVQVAGQPPVEIKRPQKRAKAQANAAE